MISRYTIQALGDVKVDVGQLPNEAVHYCLTLVREGKYDQSFIKIILDRGTDHDLMGMIRRRSEKTKKELIGISEILHPEVDLRNRLGLIPILWIPRSAFVLAAIRFNEYRFILCSEGFGSAIDLTAESMIMGMLLPQKLILDGKSEADQKKQLSDFNNVYLRLFSSFVENSSVYMPHLFPEMPHNMRGATHLLESGMRIFATLHEIGHIELGHLEGGWLWRLLRRGVTARLEDMPVKESDTRMRREEYDADAFALKQAHDPEKLLGGAELFFLMLCLVQNMRSHKSDSHPHVDNRLASLRQLAKVPMGDTFKSSARLRALIGEKAVNFDEDVSYDQQLIAHPDAPDELLPVHWFYDLGMELISDFKKRPLAYKDVVPFY